MSEPSSDPPNTSPEEAFHVTEPESSVPLIDQIINSALEGLPPNSPVGRLIKVARVTRRGCPPTLKTGTIRPPTMAENIQVKVLAVGIWARVRDRVVADNPVTSSVPLPFDPSVDGVVQDEITGNTYYVLPRINPRGFGLLSEYVNIPKNSLLKVPKTDNPVLIAGLAGTWLTCWSLLLTCHKRRVIIIGATTCLGRAAAWIAKWLGASMVIGLTNDPTAAPVNGLDVLLFLTRPLELPKFDGIEIVIDFLGWDIGEQVLKQINNDTDHGVDYMPAWTPHENEPWEVDDDLFEDKGLEIVDPALEMCHLTELQLRERLRFGLGLMRFLPQTPFEIVARPMSEVQTAWDEEDFKALRKTLVLVPGDMGGEGKDAPCSEQAQESSC